MIHLNTSGWSQNWLQISDPLNTILNSVNVETGHMAILDPISPKPTNLKILPNWERHRERLETKTKELWTIIFNIHHLLQTNTMDHIGIFTIISELDTIRNLCINSRLVYDMQFLVITGELCIWYHPPFALSPLYEFKFTKEAGSACKLEQIVKQLSGT